MSNLIRIIERYCNNYFNPGNDPADPQRNHPPEFLDMVERIRQFAGSIERDNIASNSIAGTQITYSLEHSEWQRAFSHELAIWKRAKFI